MRYEKAFECLGLSPDSTVYVASSSLGLLWDPRFVENIISSLCDYFRCGTVVLPSFSSSYRKNGVYSPEFDKTYCGEVAEHFRKLPFVRRSLYSPNHGVASSGERADEFSLLRPISSFGDNSVFRVLAQTPKKVHLLFIDCEVTDGMAFIHYLEEKYQVSYRYWIRLEGRVVIGDTTETLDINWYAKKQGAQLHPALYGDAFQNSGIVKASSLHHSVFRSCLLSDYLGFFEPFFSENKDFMSNNK